jgi:hypothetical protein
MGSRGPISPSAPTSSFPVRSLSFRRTTTGLVARLMAVETLLLFEECDFLRRPASARDSVDVRRRLFDALDCRYRCRGSRRDITSHPAHAVSCLNPRKVLRDGRGCYQYGSVSESHASRIDDRRIRDRKSDELGCCSELIDSFEIRINRLRSLLVVRSSNHRVKFVLLVSRMIGNQCKHLIRCVDFVGYELEC